MSKVGRQFPSEMRRYTDPVSGREVLQLTQTGLNWHYYFTDNSFTDGSDDIYYLHSDDKPADSVHADLFKIDPKTGIRTQMTDLSADFRRATVGMKSPDSEMILFEGDGDLYSLELASGRTTLLCRCPAGFQLGHANLSHDKRYIAVTACDIPVVTRRYTNENYGGFKEHFYAHKVGHVLIAPTDGSGAQTVFTDTHWLGHIQFAPDTNEYLTYCHEGPWNYVQQRIWMLNTITRQVKPCFVQEENDSIGHEFWTRDGLVFFDNRGRGHDGTITSDKTQAVTVSSDGPDDIPWIGFADKDCNIVRRLELPYYCNHYHANRDHTLLVADAVNDIVLLDISGDKPGIQTLCSHNTSWRYQRVHCHPTWSWSNDRILFASDRDREGYPQLYLVHV